MFAIFAVGELTGVRSREFRGGLCTRCKRNEVDGDTRPTYEAGKVINAYVAARATKTYQPSQCDLQRGQACRKTGWQNPKLHVTRLEISYVALWRSDESCYNRPCC